VIPKTDYERMASIYDEGRSLPLQWLQEWRDVLSQYVPTSDHHPVLDLGSGTGLFSEVLATWFQVDVIGVEPSAAMRNRAAAKRHPAGISYVGGNAERVPLRTGTCGCAWLSTVVHHISDLPACAKELRRVLRSDGRVLIRNSFGDRLEHIHWLSFFPAAKRLAAKRWPTVEQTASAFAAAGFETETLESVSEVIARDLRSYCERIRARANSTLTLISDEEFEEGLAQLGRAASRETRPEPVVDRRDLLVLR
jgi:ubiquinone/menaquinone biosynthesis C-methylase UbiE